MSSAFDALDQLFTSGISKITLWVLALSGFLLVLEAVGMLPLWLSRFINRNRLRETMRLLKEFGVDVEPWKRANSVARLDRTSRVDLKKQVTERLNGLRISNPVTIGTQVPVESDRFFDLMGATADINVAKRYARDLSALWREIAGVGGPVRNIDIDFIVTPKTGSPLLEYDSESARLIKAEPSVVKVA